MEFLDIAKKVNENKSRLEKVLESAKLSEEERESLHKSMKNYDYILELTDLGHYSRGSDVY